MEEVDGFSGVFHPCEHMLRSEVKHDSSLVAVDPRASLQRHQWGYRTFPCAGGDIHLVRLPASSTAASATRPANWGTRCCFCGKEPADNEEAAKKVVWTWYEWPRPGALTLCCATRRHGFWHGAVAFWNSRKFSLW